MKIQFAVVATWLAITSTWPSTVSAHSTLAGETGSNVAGLIEHSNLIFVGRVARVEYRRAESTEGVPHPFTFVTYDIDEVLLGRPLAKTITLRFIGGSDGRGRFVEVNGVPLFEPGEHDILFVVGNGETECPLVMCEFGRYRIHDYGVYNSHGAPVRALIKGQAVARGAPPEEFLTLQYPTPTFDELIKDPEVQAEIKRMGVRTEALRRRYAAEAPSEMILTDVLATTRGANTDRLTAVKANAKIPSQARAMLPQPIPDGPIAVEEFTSTLKELIARSKRKPIGIRSIDPRAPIRMAVAKERPPAAPVASRRAASGQTREERAELDALEKQDFNPVIPRR